MITLYKVCKKSTPTKVLRLAQPGEGPVLELGCFRYDVVEINHVDRTIIIGDGPKSIDPVVTMSQTKASSLGKQEETMFTHVLIVRPEDQNLWEQIEKIVTQDFNYPQASLGTIVYIPPLVADGDAREKIFGAAHALPEESNTLLLFFGSAYNLRQEEAYLFMQTLGEFAADLDHVTERDGLVGGFTVYGVWLLGDQHFVLEPNRLVAV